MATNFLRYRTDDGHVGGACSSRMATGFYDKGGADDDRGKWSLLKQDGHLFLTGMERVWWSLLKQDGH